MKIWHSEMVAVHDRSIHHASPFHKHEEYEFYLFLNGDAVFFTESHGYKLSPGDLFIIPPQLWHRAQTFEDQIYERVYLNLPLEAIIEFSTSQTNLTQILPLPKSQPKILRLDASARAHFTKSIDQMIRLKAGQTIGYDIQINLILIELLLQLNRYGSSESTITHVALPTMIVDLIAYIDRHLTGSLSLQKMSQALHLSESHLSRSFKKFMGLTLQDYITNKRIDKATELLKDGASVQDAAYASGYENYAHFIRSFKKTKGLSPGKFRKQHYFS